MKRKLVRLVLGFAYMALLTLLLLSQMQAGAYERGRWIATLSVLVIGVPWMIVLRLYNRTPNETISPDQGNGQKSDQTNMSEDRAEQGQTTDLTSIREMFDGAVHGYGLTEREKEVAWLLYRGYTNRQIGEDLFIAETTVKKHVSHIYEKMQVMSRKEFRNKVDHF